MYVCRGGAKPPLTTAYSGLYVVVSKSPKYFVLDLGDRQESVSVDRLKDMPASLFSLRLRLPAVGGLLLHRWLPCSRHLGGSSVETRNPRDLQLIHELVYM